MFIIINEKIIKFNNIKYNVFIISTLFIVHFKEKIKVVEEQVNKDMTNIVEYLISLRNLVINNLI